MTETDFLGFDADNHYYEALDAFTRYADPKFSQRCVQWCDIGGRKYHLVGDKVCRAVANPTFDPIVKPGAAYEFYRGNSGGKPFQEFTKDREPIPAYYRNRDARLEIMDQQGLEKVWLFPTLGVLYEELIKNDLAAVRHTFTAFNRWIQDDWGCNYKDRIFAVPYITLADVDHACSELQWALDHGARIIAMRPAAPTTIYGQRSPFGDHFDSFWGLVNEAGITVAAHAGDSGYASHGYADDEFSSISKARPSVNNFRLERAAHDFFISAALEKLFDRFPNVRLASVENGSAWLGALFRRLTSAYHKAPKYFGCDPVELFKQHVWINPFWEDDSYQVIATMGADRVIFGSDWPHIEGLPQPLDYERQIKELDAASKRRILRDNAEFLTTLHPC